MRILFYILISIFLSSATGYAQDKRAVLGIKMGETAELPKKVERKYLRDAARLVLRMQAKNEELRFMNIDIPKDHISHVYSILTNIYSQDETARSIAKCNIHTHPNPSIDHFVIIFDKTVEWAAPLQDGISETDSDQFNELLDEYDLVIDKHMQWSEHQDAITIRSKEPLNMAALANEFYNIEGIEEIDLGIPKIDGNDIVLHEVADGWEVEYILRFGNSFMQDETSQHSWKFKVYENGMIELLQESGDEIPEWMRCNFEENHGLVSNG